MPERRCLLTVHAHPDDEASKGASTVAKYHALGVHTVLVCCTGGEEGDILNPALDLPEVRAELPTIRLRELDQSARIIGYDDVVLLGYRDSGMPGTAANANPEAFANASFDEAVGRLVTVIRRERPQVVVTYGDEQSEYPHPDHLRVHEISLAAWDAAADADRFAEAGPAFAPSKLYYNVWPHRRIRAMHEKYLELGLLSPFGDRWLTRMERGGPITTSVALDGFVGVRGEALRAHATQVDPTSPFWFGSPEVPQTVYPYEDYFLARSRVGPTDVVDEGDLFAGIE